MNNPDRLRQVFDKYGLLDFMDFNQFCAAVSELMETTNKEGERLENATELLSPYRVNPCDKDSPYKDYVRYVDAKAMMQVHTVERLAALRDELTQPAPINSGKSREECLQGCDQFLDDHFAEICIPKSQVLEAMQTYADQFKNIKP